MSRGYRDQDDDERAEEELVWLKIEVYHQTDKAILIDEMPQPVWLAKSVIRDFEPVGHKDRLEMLDRRDETKVQVPAWYVERHLLDDYVVKP